MTKLWNIWSTVLLLGFVVNGDKEIIPSNDLPKANVRSEKLLKEKEKEDDAHTRAFPIMDMFKTSQLYSADDLRESDEFKHKRDNIAEAVENALEKLHKQEQEESNNKMDNAKKKQPAKHFISTKKLVDEIVKQELESSGNDDDAADDNKKDKTATTKDHVELEKQIHDKLGEISKLETKLFVLVRDIKGFLLEKKKDSEHSLGEKDFNVPLSTLMSNSESEKRTLPSVPSLAELRRNPHLVDKIVDNALDEGSDDKNEDGTAQGHTRNILTDHVSLKDYVKGSIDDTPLSKLAEESDESDTLATDRDVSRDGLVESPLSAQDYKKTLGKKFRHAVI